MLFDLQAYIADLKENPEKKEVAEKFVKFFWEVEGDITAQNRYTEYVAWFEAIDYKVPEELKEDFDRKILMQLVASSFSSDGLLESTEDGALDFVISVQNGDQVVVKKVSELRWFQILRLFEIYVEEQMNLQILIAEDEKEKEAILAQRDARINRRKLVMDNREKDKLEKEAAEERDEKLWDLYGQL